MKYNLMYFDCKCPHHRYRVIFALVFRYHQSYLAPLFQMEFLRKTFHMKMSLSFYMKINL